MKIQFVSDLHLEFPDNRAWLAAHPLEVTGDILLIAGDTAYLDLPDSGRETYKAISGIGLRAITSKSSCASATMISTAIMIWQPCRITIVWTSAQT